MERIKQSSGHFFLPLNPERLLTPVLSSVRGQKFPSRIKKGIGKSRSLGVYVSLVKANSSTGMPLFPLRKQLGPGTKMKNVNSENRPLYGRIPLGCERKQKYNNAIDPFKKPKMTNMRICGTDPFIEAKKTGKNICDILAERMREQKCKGRGADSVLVRKIKEAQKRFGCRRIGKGS